MVKIMDIVLVRVAGDLEVLGVSVVDADGPRLAELVYEVEQVAVRVPGEDRSGVGVVVVLLRERLLLETAHGARVHGFVLRGAAECLLESEAPLSGHPGEVVAEPLRVVQLGTKLSLGVVVRGPRVVERHDVGSPQTSVAGKPEAYEECTRFVKNWRKSSSRVLQGLSF